jgi:hypothetical protein
MFDRILPLIAAGALALAVSAPARSQIVATPRAAPIPTTAASRPFLAAMSTAQPLDLASRGYAESEYVVCGLASAYEWNAAGAGGLA